jgi:hypothetical protein
VGDLVEVRNEQEILATLDDQGAIGGMPFMPEMLEFCGKRFPVSKRSDKTCDTITEKGSRRLYDTVHLKGLRCSGSAHGQCQAQCSLFWNEAWLKRVEKADASPRFSPSQGERAPFSPLRCDRARLDDLTLRFDPPNRSEVFYRCQATDLLKASEPMAWWDIRQYVRDVRSGNVGLMELFRAALFRIFLKTLKVTAYRAQLWIYNRLQSWRGGTLYPFSWGKLDKTPRAVLDLQCGEMVHVKPHDEILQTLDTKNRNRGLKFDAEMVPYCGSLRRVQARVGRLIDERTGKMIHLSNDCVILEDVICRGDYTDRKLFCPRSLYLYWREIWLRRVETAPGSEAKADPSGRVGAQD